jgi:hypothetical protein
MQRNSSKETRNKKVHVGFEVLKAVIMKSTIIWDLTLCIPLKVNRRFGGTYLFHLKGRRISRARTSIKACHLLP